MVKSFKLRITRVITTTLQSCHSKHHFTLPKDHVPSFSRISPWQKEEKWHVVAKIYEEKTPGRKIYNFYAFDSSDDDNLTFAAPRSLLPPSPKEKKKRRGKKKKKNIPSRLSISTSLADSGWFNSEGSVSVGDERDEEETEKETLVSSSIRFSTYLSSEFDSRLHSIQETPFTLCEHVCTPTLPLSKDGNSIICDLMKLPFRN
ncbi:Transcription repressor [Abeliophyllum distichum]|uniref:Transcription repressor n=1 Tax=Abeliophyllum distichum TaxID=126358 RepID=A0ABD1V737_9LAMI